MKFKLIDSYEYDHIHNVLGSTLKFFSTAFTDYKLRESIESHLDTPSLLAVKDILAEYGIASSVIRKDNYSYEEFETPFISLIRHPDWPDKNFTLVTKVDSGYVEFLDAAKNKLLTLKLEEFEKIDENIVLLIDGSEKRNEEEYNTNRNKEIKNRISILIPFAVTLILLIYNLIFRSNYTENDTVQKIFYLFSFCFGTLISGTLIWQEIDSHNPFFRKLCGGAREEKSDCDVVLSSSSAKFLGLNWSIWGLSFFLTLFFVHLLLYNSATTFLCAGSSILAAPYIIYSIYHQARIIKKWCRLCLVVQFVLGINFLIALSLNYHFTDLFDWSIIGVTVLLGVLIVFLSNAMFNNLKKAKKGSLVEKRWRKLRYNESIFKALLQQQPRLESNPDNLGILIGDPTAPIEIIKICNLYCGPCAIAHKEITKLLAKEKQIKLRIIFNPNGQANDKNTIMAFYFLGIEEKYGVEVFHHALEEWFLSETKDFKEFSNKYPLDEDLNKYLPKTKMMSDWCHKMNINRTPTFFINGYPLPEEYSFADFKYLF